MVTAEYRFRLENDDGGQVRVNDHIVVSKNFDGVNNQVNLKFIVKSYLF